ncbi:GAF domain-containing protein [Actinoplanes sp. CA-252034]|uniref:GAF domain-containing protein n=1 Tax=Actinoplanes sp. CA-252034 TaxID=3239906 RepID=UPI003D96F3FA
MGSERERERVAVLREYHLLDTPPAAELEAVVRVAATVAEVPTATLNLLDDVKQYQFTTVGFTGRQCARKDSMCAVRLDRGAFVHLPDAREEPDYRDNPWVTGRLGRIVFYASAPLISADGYVMGTLCVFDRRARRLSPEQIGRLRDLAGIVVAFFERRRLARLAAGLKETIQARDRWARTMLDSIDEAVIAVEPGGRVTVINRAAHALHPDADPAAGAAGSAARYRLYEPDGRTPVPDDEVPLVVVMREGFPVKGRELVIRTPGREPRSVVANAAPLRSADGTVNGAVVALHDVTAEHARRRIIEEARERLAAANAELRRSNADLTNFAGAVSHDLVAPLAAVGDTWSCSATRTRRPGIRGWPAGSRRRRRRWPGCGT